MSPFYFLQKHNIGLIFPIFYSILVTWSGVLTQYYKSTFTAGMAPLPSTTPGEIRSPQEAQLRSVEFAGSRPASCDYVFVSVSSIQNLRLVAGVLDEPCSQLSPLSGVAVQARQST